jgi:hypothetical protein
MHHAIASSLLLLASCCAHQARSGGPASGPAGAPVITCELSIADSAIVPGDPVIVRVRLRNAGRSKSWVVRTIDPMDAEWQLDGRDDAARLSDALAALRPSPDEQGVSFSGRTGTGYGLADYIELAPGQHRTFEVDVIGMFAGETTVMDGDIDISTGTILRRALDTPGRHQLGATVRSYPASEYHRDDDPPYDAAWEARCAPVELTTNAVAAPHAAP